MCHWFVVMGSLLVVMVKTQPVTLALNLVLGSASFEVVSGCAVGGFDRLAL